MAPLLSYRDWQRALESAERKAGDANNHEAQLIYARAGLVPDEHTEQSWLIQRLALLEGRIPELALIFAVPNGGLRSERTAGRLKAEGVKPNVPDLMWPVARGRHHGLFVEMKRVGGHASPGQRALHGLLRAQGYYVVTCQGAEAAYHAVTAYWEFGPFTWGPA